MVTIKFFFAGKYYSFYRISLGMISIAVLYLFILRCADDIIYPMETELEFLGFTENFALRMAILDPYLFVCAGSNGIWRKNIRVLSEWEYLGLEDSSLGKYTNVGALDIDISNNEIFVAYNGANPNVLPANIVSIWRSTNDGANWQRADMGIPETINDSLEYNILTSLQRSPHNSEIIIAWIDPTSYRSTDGGNTWKILFGQRGFIPGNGLVRWHPLRSGEVWFIGQSALFAPYCFAKSDYGTRSKVGIDFNSLGFSSDANVYDITFSVTNPEIVHITTSESIISTNDGGYTWRKNLIKLPDNEFGFRMVAHPKIEGLFYIGGGKNIYKVTGGGAKVEFIEKIEKGFITSLIYDSQGDQLFIGTTEGGIYVLRSVNK